MGTPPNHIEHETRGPASPTLGLYAVGLIDSRDDPLLGVTNSRLARTAPAAP